MRVEAYKNLTKDCISVREAHGKVFAHCDIAVVMYPEFVVQPAGRQRVLDEQVKNVHAFVRGKRGGETDYPSNWEDMKETINKLFHKVTYNPFKHDSFVYAEDETPVDKDYNMAYVTTEGVYV